MEEKEVVNEPDSNGRAGIRPRRQDPGKLLAVWLEEGCIVGFGEVYLMGVEVAVGDDVEDVCRDGRDE